MLFAFSALAIAIAGSSAPGITTIFDRAWEEETDS